MSIIHEKTHIIQLSAIRDWFLKKKFSKEKFLKKNFFRKKKLLVGDHGGWKKVKTAKLSFCKHTSEVYWSRRSRKVGGMRQTGVPGVFGTRQIEQVIQTVWHGGFHGALVDPLAHLQSTTRTLRPFFLRGYAMCWLKDLREEMGRHVVESRIAVRSWLWPRRSCRAICRGNTGRRKCRWKPLQVVLRFWKMKSTLTKNEKKKSARKTWRRNENGTALTWLRRTGCSDWSCLAMSSFTSKYRWLLYFTKGWKIQWIPSLSMPPFLWICTKSSNFRNRPIWLYFGKNVQKCGKTVEKTQEMWKKCGKNTKNVGKTQEIWKNCGKNTRNVEKMWKKTQVIWKKCGKNTKNVGKTQEIWKNCGKNTRNVKKTQEIWKNVEKTREIWKNCGKKHKECGKMWEKHKKYGKNVEKTQGMWKNCGKNTRNVEKCGKNTRNMEKMWKKHKECGKNTKKWDQFLEILKFLWKIKETNVLLIGWEFRRKYWFFETFEFIMEGEVENYEWPFAS